MPIEMHWLGSCFEADQLFPCDDGGTNVQATPEAAALARRLLKVPSDTNLFWILPDEKFLPDAYGYIGTVSASGDLSIEFWYRT
jgi:hypothetical protein